MSKQVFRSPILKLLTFFQRSRDRWKEKCKQAKKELKSLKVCHAALKASRDYWKQKARESAIAGSATEPTGDSKIKSDASPSARYGRRQTRVVARSGCDR